MAETIRGRDSGGAFFRVSFELSGDLSQTNVHLGNIFDLLSDFGGLAIVLYCLGHLLVK